MLNKTIIYIAALFLCLPAFGQEKEAREVVKTLCSDTLYGRGYVFDGVNKAAQYVKTEFEKVGLKPFFGDTSYFQRFRFDVNTFPGKMQVEVNGRELKPGIDYLADNLSGSFKGQLELIKVDTNTLSKTHLLQPMIKKVRKGRKDGFYIDLTGVKAHDAYGLVREFNSLATLGAVVYTTDQKFTWSVARQRMKYPILHIKTGKYSFGDDIKINIESKLIKNFPNKNVVGFLPAKDKNAKTIVFSAHYDHLGVMGTFPDTTIFPGGNDNASGTSMLISMANYFVKNPSNYNMVFIAFAGEEAGLLGSRYFVENKTMDLSKIKFLINLDIMGSGEEGITAVNGKVFNKKFKKLLEINEENGYLSQVKSRGEAANSDHYFFYKAGVPSFFIYTMGPNKNYHDVYDTYGDLSFAAYDNIVKLLVHFVAEL